MRKDEVLIKNTKRPLRRHVHIPMSQLIIFHVSLIIIPHQIDLLSSFQFHYDQQFTWYFNLFIFVVENFLQNLCPRLFCWSREMGWSEFRIIAQFCPWCKRFVCNQKRCGKFLHSTEMCWVTLKCSVCANTANFPRDQDWRTHDAIRSEE